MLLSCAPVSDPASEVGVIGTGKSGGREGLHMCGVDVAVVGLVEVPEGDGEEVDVPAGPAATDELVVANVEVDADASPAMADGLVEVPEGGGAEADVPA